MRAALGPIATIAVVDPILLWPLAFGITCAAIWVLLALPLAWLKLKRSPWLESRWAPTAAIAAALLLTAKPWFLDTGWPIAVACALFGLSGPVWMPAVRAHRGVRLALWLAATALVWVCARVFVALYPTLHMAATLLGLLLAAYATTTALPERLPRPVLWLASVAMLGSCWLSLTPWGSRVELRAYALSHRSITPDVLALAWSLADFDNDGAATIWGGSDCAAFDSGRGPGNWDAPGDGIDQDCSGSDRIVRNLKRPPDARRGPSVRAVVIITGDALRFDAIGAYGREKRSITAHIDAWARNAVRFERAYAPAPRTHLSLPALLWGRDQSQRSVPLGTRVRARRELRARAVLPAATLVDALVRRAGFELTRAPEQDSERINAHVWDPLSEVLQHGGVLWVHYHDPHAPYVDVPGVHWGDDDRARYLGLVTRLDRAVGALLSRIPPDAAVILSADHGEAFGEHGMYFHRSSLYDEQIRIPLLISAPSIEPRVVKQTVGLIDVYATTLDLLGLDPSPGIESRSLLPALLGEPLVDVPYRAFAQQHSTDDAHGFSWIGVFYREFKLLRRVDWNLEELYDVGADPRELNPNSASAMRMRDALVAMQ